MRLLHIDASPRAERSRSRAVAKRFLAALSPAVEVRRLDLWNRALPTLGGGMIEGRYSLLMGAPVEEGIAREWEEVRRIAKNFLEHDAYLISTPMWNFGIPYILKHYIDVVTQPGITFRNDAAGNVEGLAAGRRALVIAASAMPFGMNESIAGLDHQARYLEAWLAFIGVEQVRTIRVSPTFGPEDEVVEAIEKAAGTAEQVARCWL